MLEQENKATRYTLDNLSTVKQDYKPQYHLSTPIGWMNDPNGFVYYQGEYHLFYQHYPYDSVWGPMHWGHAKSKDLVTWEDLPVALEPTEEYESEGCFSGSAIEKDGKLYLLYTGHVERDGVRRETQCLAYSEDGVHFEKYSGNPVISEEHIQGVADIGDFRDPKVFEKNGMYYCVIASKTPDERGRILLFKSSDLFEWEFVSILLEGTKEQGIMWECPDLFELDGQDVLIMSPIEIPKDGYQYDNTSSTVAFIGKVDWETGKFETENYHEIDFGLDFYAPQTCVDDQGRRIMVAWMQMWHRTMPTHDLKHGWVGSMSLPRELKVRNHYLVQEPISFLTNRLEVEKDIKEVSLREDYYLVDGFVKSGKIDLVLELQADLEIKLGGADEYLSLFYDFKEETLVFDRRKSGFELVGAEKEPLNIRRVKCPLVNQELQLSLYSDISALEIFTSEGKTVTSTFYKKGHDYDLMISQSPNGKIKTLKISRLK
ncbi:glycoside hydrolase family 32 protein [Vagococcus salmoninarum]|uniref:glycoside hydrolase family 32 protein n=1 Tax=Vagococcus salmoninarum TaxID=2739 RepID=UPI003F97CC86